MIKVDEALILKLETLARLQLSDQERQRLRGDLEAVLAMVEKLEEVNTEGVAPLLHLSGDHQELREDEVKGQLSEEDALLNAPEKKTTLFQGAKSNRAKLNQMQWKKNRLFRYEILQNPIRWAVQRSKPSNILILTSTPMNSSP